MPWITPTPETVKSRISGPEFTSLQNAAKASGKDGGTLVQDAITSTVNRIRGRVAAYEKNILGEPGKIPDELISCFGALWLWEFITRLPGQEKLLDDRRMKLYDNAIAELKDVARGQMAIVPPDPVGEPSVQAAGPGAELVTSRRNVQDRCDTRGLL